MFRMRVAHMMQVHRSDHWWLRAVVESMVTKMGCVPQTPLSHVKREEVDAGTCDGLNSSQRERLAQLWHDDEPPCQAIDTLKAASAFLLKLRFRQFSPKRSSRLLEELDCFMRCRRPCLSADRLPMRWCTNPTGGSQQPSSRYTERMAEARILSAVVSC